MNTIFQHGCSIIYDQRRENCDSDDDHDDDNDNDNDKNDNSVRLLHELSQCFLHN